MESCAFAAASAASSASVLLSGLAPSLSDSETSHLCPVHWPNCLARSPANVSGALPARAISKRPGCNPTSRTWLRIRAASSISLFASASVTISMRLCGIVCWLLAWLFDWSTDNNSAADGAFWLNPRGLNSEGVDCGGVLVDAGVFEAEDSFCKISLGVGINAACARRIISISQLAAESGAYITSPCPFSNNCHARPSRAMPNLARSPTVCLSLSIRSSDGAPAACMLARWIRSSRSATSISGEEPSE